MNKLNYWQIIKDCNWKSDCDYERIQKYLFQKYNKEERIKIEKFARQQLTKLYKQLDQYSLQKTGNKYAYFLQDDSGSDLRAHIVGLGEKEFNKVILNPELARKRGTKHDYTENFMYSFHFEDFEQYN